VDLRDTRFIADSIINGTLKDIALSDVDAETLRQAIILAANGNYQTLDDVIDNEDDDDEEEDTEEISTLEIMRDFSQPMSFFQVIRSLHYEKRNLNFE
jgi:hypothetical protein